MILTKLRTLEAKIALPQYNIYSGKDLEPWIAREHEYYTKHSKLPNPNELSAKLHQHTNALNLSPTTKQAIKKYTDTSSLINTYLRRPLAFTDDDELREHQNIVKNLNQAVNNSRMPFALTIFRGLRVSPIGNFVPQEKYQPGRIYRHQGFTSTAVHPASAVSFSQWGSPTIMQIHVPQHAHALYVAPHSRFPEERELLLPPNSHFKILGHEAYQDNNGGSSFHIINARLLPRQVSNPAEHL